MRWSGRATSRPAILVVSALALLLVVACGRNTGGNADVIATTAIVGAFTKEVVGDALTTGTIVGPGVDPHEYEASPDDATRIARAKVVLRNGLGLDAGLDKVIASS